MSFYDVVKQFRDFDFQGYFEKVTEEDVKRSIYNEHQTYEDFLNLISPKGENFLEEMAQRAYSLTRQYFGNTILLYTPMYLSNYCVNKCAYCGYNVCSKIKRKKLNTEEIEQEGKCISEDGFKHILILTGESEFHTPVKYLVEATKVLKPIFPSITIEVFPMNTEDYKTLVEEGVDGLTIYQEVYNEEIYDKVHISGPKKDYKFRLDAPENGARAGMRFLNIGSLLGLSDFRQESFFTALHGKYLREKYADVEVAYSLPRIRPFGGEFKDIKEVSDKNLVQTLLALRIFHPNGGINISTRESSEFRENILPLGVTKLSGGVSTEVGGHSIEEKGEGQFEISDDRSIVEIKEMLRNKGFEPIFKDWERI